MRETLHVVECGDGADIQQQDRKHGNRSATRYTRAALADADYLGKLPARLAQLVGRSRPVAA